MLNELNEELTKLLSEKNVLIRENKQLRERINHLQNGNNGIFSHLTDNEKRVMRGDIMDLIRRIDKHISKQQ